MRTQLIDIPEAVKKIPTRKSIATHELHFTVKLEPVSYKTFYVRKFRLHHRCTSDDQSTSDCDVESSSEKNKDNGKRIRRSLYNDQYRQRRSTSDNGHQWKRRSLSKHRQHRLTSVDNRRKRRSLHNYQQWRQIYLTKDLNSTKKRPSDVNFQGALKYFPRRKEVDKFEVDVKDQLAEEKFTFGNLVRT